MDEEVRVTTQAEVFDDHFESHEFLSPGGRVFEHLAKTVGSEESADGDLAGRFWLVHKTDRNVLQFYARRDEGVNVIYSFDELLQALDNVAPPVRVGSDGADFAGSVRVLA